MIIKTMVFLILTPLMCFAESKDLNKSLNNYYNKFGSSGNLTAGAVYDGQRAGYMTGGGLSLRNRVMNEKIATISLPKFEAGCGGIDIFSGSMSFIKKDQIINQLKSVASNTAGYAFLLGLETLSPQSSNVMKQLQSWANQINGININSCEIASSLVDAAFPQKNLAEQQSCKNAAGAYANSSDQVEARGRCANKEGKSEVEVLKEANNPEMLKEEFNLAWEAIKFHDNSENYAEKEFFMSLMGTIIIRKDKDGNPKTDVIPSKINNESFLQVLLNGGTTEGLDCSGINKHEKCLVVITSNTTIPHENSFIGKVEERLTRIQTCIWNEEELSESDKQFLAQSRLPLWSFVNALTAYKKGYSPVDLSKVANIVAMDVLIKYLREVIEIVQSGCMQLKSKEAYTTDINEYLKTLAHIERTIKQHETRNRDMLLQEKHLIELIEKINQQLLSEIRIH